MAQHARLVIKSMEKIKYLDPCLKARVVHGTKCKALLGMELSTLQA